MRFIPIQDINIPELALFNERAETKLYRFYEPDPGLFVAETPMVIERALNAGYQPVAMAGEERIAKQEAERLKDRLGDIPIYISDERVLSEIAGYRLARGLLCEFRRRRNADIDRILSCARRIAVLEEVTNPTNVGAIFRSAAALGMDAVLLSGGCADPLYRRASRVSVGNVFTVPWTFYDSRVTAKGRIEMLKEQGFYTAAMALGAGAVKLGSRSCSDIEKLAVILGNEGGGLKNETIAACDEVVMIPMKNGVDSLNVAAASAVAFWEFNRG